MCSTLCFCYSLSFAIPGQQNLTLEDDDLMPKIGEEQVEAASGSLNSVSYHTPGSMAALKSCFACSLPPVVFIHRPQRVP
jgi:hypothetical protein